MENKDVKPTELEFVSHGDDHLIHAIPLRDWFAGMALQGYIHLIGMPTDAPDNSWDGDIAKRAYAMSDAMLKAREGEGKP